MTRQFLDALVLHALFRTLYSKECIIDERLLDGAYPKRTLNILDDRTCTAVHVPSGYR